MSEKDVLFGLIVPNRPKPNRRSCSAGLVEANTFLALKASSRKLKSTLPRSGPLPGPVMMSMNIIPIMPPWFCAAYMSIRGSRIDRICDLEGSRPPVKPSTRMTDPAGAIALSAASISSGSSGSASICSRVSTVLNALPPGSSDDDCLSRPTVTDSSSFWIWSVMRRRVSPSRTRTSRTTAVWKPGNSTWIV